MIHVTRLDGSALMINCDLLETVERTPDTVISLLNGRKLVVKESVSEIVARVIEFRRMSGVCALLQNHLSGVACATHEVADSTAGVGT